MQLWALIVDSFRESLDRKVFWVLVGITMIVVLAMLCVGFEGNKVSLLFGLYEEETEYFSLDSDAGRLRIAGIMIYGIMAYMLGWIGMILAIIATAGAFPSMMQQGRIDVLLSKPISRPKLFLCKYLSSMVFVFLQAALFVVLTFLVMGLRWGVWIPGYPLSIPLLVLLFSYLYCISVLVAVKMRSSVAAILLTIAAWVVFVSPQIVLGMSVQMPAIRENEAAYRALLVVNWVPPKTWDIPNLAANWAGVGPSMDMMPESVVEESSEDERVKIELARELEQELAMTPLQFIGSSLIFEAVIIVWAMWGFCRKDF